MGLENQTESKNKTDSSLGALFGVAATLPN